MSQELQVEGDYWLTIFLDEGFNGEVPPFLPQVIRLGTRTALRSGQWFRGQLLTVTAPSEDFALGSVSFSERVTIRIALEELNAVGSNLAADLAFWSAAWYLSFEALLEVETRTLAPDGTWQSVISQRRMRHLSHSFEANTMTLVLSSLDDSVLDELYPGANYTTAEYPNIDPLAADQPIAFPVGTALKIPCRLLAAQTLWDGTVRAPEWLYGVCELEWQSYPIVAVNTGAQQFSIAGDRTAQINVGDSIWVFDPASRTNVTNEGKYTISARTFTSPNTVITVNETVGIATVTSNINIPPKVLNVYRNGRLVNPSEYTIEVLDNGAGPVPATIGNFSTAATDWFAIAGGTGTATVGTGAAVITGDGGAVNLGRVNLFAGVGGGLQQRRSMYAPWRVTVTGSGAAWISDAPSFPIAGNGTLVRAGSPVRVLVRRGVNSGDLRCAMTTLNAGATGTNLTFDNWSIERPAKPLLMIRFTREQRDPGGGLYTIEADVLGYRSRNVADEINRLMTELGLTINAASLTSAQGFATTNRMLVDCDYGARGARKLRAILEDLLFIARGALVRDGAAGDYVLVQDRQDVPGVGTFDEFAGDLVEAQSIDRNRMLKAVEVRYRPSSRDPKNLLHTLRRNVYGAFGTGVESRPCPYLRDHEAADRLVSYLFSRYFYNRRLRARLYLQRFALGRGISIRSPRVLRGYAAFTFNGILRKVQHTPAGIDVEIVEQTGLDTYISGTLPADINEPYQPDYSQTPPAAPTALRITAAIGGTGRVSIEARPPVENWAEVWFVVTHNTNLQIMGLVLGTFSATTGLATATIGGLTTGQTYRLEAYAKNAFLLQGTIQGTFDNTINGGSATAVTFTA